MIIEPLSLDAKNFIKIFWNITNKCNYNCSYCNPIYKKNTYKWIDNKDNFIFLDNIKKYFNNKTLSIQITGGEPTINKNYIDLLNYIKENLPFAYIETYTNGSKSLTWWKKTAIFFDAIHLSIHVQYVKEKELENIKSLILFLLSKNVQLLNCTIMFDKRFTKKSLEVFEILYKIQNKNLFVFLKQMHNSHGYPNLNCEYDNQDFKLMKRIMYENIYKLLEHPFAVAVTHYPAIFKNFKYELLDNAKFNKNLFGWTCSAGHSSFHTDWNGNILRCANSKEIVGSIPNKWFKPLTKSKKCEENLCGFFQPQIQSKRKYE